MKIEVFADADAVAREAATLIAADARAAVAQRGRFIMAVSGGHTPWVMLSALAGEKVPWDKVYMAQVDERLAPKGASRPKSHSFTGKPARACPITSRTNLRYAGGSIGSAGSGEAVRLNTGENRRLPSGARSCPFGARSRWAHCFIGAGRPGPGD
jgi:Glucosamine-6-phosphate isomerases/6-phosphogluconolactonase